MVDPFGIGSLTLGVPEEELERAIAAEAFRRGLEELKILELLHNRRKARAEPAPRYGGLRTGLQLTPFDVGAGLAKMVSEESSHYRSITAEEFNRQSDFFRNAFADPDGPNAKRGHPKFGTDDWQRNNLVYFLNMRSRYHLAGFDDPERTIFSQIGKARVLNHDVIGGLHMKFAEKLNQLGGILDGWAMGLAAKIDAELGDIGGFVPRFIAGSQTLSNHALGLAIDVDYVTNPHIKHPEVIKALNAVITDTSFDFGKAALGGDDLRGVSRLDQIAQIHHRSRAASREVQVWLGKHLPRYQTLKQALADAKQRQKKQLDLERKLMRDRSGKMNVEGATSTAEAWESERAVLAEINADADLLRLQLLEKHHPISEIEKWKDIGIQTLSLEFAAAVGTIAGVRWGEEYRGHKDAMHFELEGGVRPDSEPRDPELHDLVAPSAKPWYLLAESKRKR
jgi:hypothetical protein